MSEAKLLTTLALLEHRARGSISYEQGALFALISTIAGTALGAYSAGPVPVQWLAQSLIIATALLLSFHHIYRVPGTSLFVILAAWGLVVTLANTALRDFGGRMPGLATTPYPIFLALRFMALLSFGATLYVVYWLLVRGRVTQVRRWLVWLGAATALVALYVYVAQLYGWWEPVRSRLGTGGAVSSGIFSYAFHRAMGTFREPSHLAEWLIVPFFLSFVHPGRERPFMTISIGSALLLTGSLTGIVGAALGLFSALLITNPFRGAKLRLVIQITIALALALLVFNWLAVSYGPERMSLYEVLETRIKPILFEGGLSQSNRSYVYDYVGAQPLPITGAGWGNANILFSHAMGNPLVTSFVSLYLNTLLSTGMVGLLLLIAFLARPVVEAARSAAQRDDLYLLTLLAGYIAWLVMFAVHSEELAVMFGVIMALITFEARPDAAPESVPQ